MDAELIPAASLQEDSLPGSHANTFVRLRFQVQQGVVSGL